MEVRSKTPVCEQRSSDRSWVEGDQRVVQFPVCRPRLAPAADNFQNEAADFPAHIFNRFLLPGDTPWIVSREDLILSKLFWAKDSRSEMQLRDVRSLLTMDCEMEYLRSRAPVLGVQGLLEEVLGRDE